MPRKKEETPWTNGDPGKKIGLNLQLPEPLMMQLDYLIENKAIHSKSSFIREVVADAATHEVERLWRVREAVRRMEAEEGKSGRAPIKRRTRSREAQG